MGIVATFISLALAGMVLAWVHLSFRERRLVSVTLVLQEMLAFFLFVVILAIGMAVIG